MAEQIVPTVGMGVTQGCGSDCYPYTVVEVKSPKSIVIQSDNYKRTDSNGMSECQEYDYSPNPDGSLVWITLRNNGSWYRRGQEKGYGGFSLGHRRAYRDPHF